MHLAYSRNFSIKYFLRVTICETDTVGISSSRSLHFCNKFFLWTFDPGDAHHPLGRPTENVQKSTFISTQQHTHEHFSASH